MSTLLTDEQQKTVLANVPLVEHIVNRVAMNLPASHARDDLVQTGIVGLITATLRFDPSKGAAFSTFAGRRIEGAIIDMLRQSDWAPRSVRSLERRLNAAEERNNGLAKTVERVAAELGCDVNELHRLRNDVAKARLDSLDRPVGSEDAVIPLSATVVDERTSTDEALDDQELRGYLRDGVALLPERHRVVVVGFFFEGKSITDLGKLLGVTQSRASQLKDEALRMLRESLREVYAEQPASTGPGAEPGDEPDGGRKPSKRQQAFNQSMAETPWRDRLASGKGVSL